MASFTAALKQWVIDTYQTKMGADDNYVTDAEKAALHSHANKTALDAVSGTNTGDEPDASTSVKGVVELATTAEATTGTDTTRATTPAGVKAALDAKTASDMSTYVTVERVSSLEPMPMVGATITAQGTTPLAIEHFGGYTWGQLSGDIYRSADNGETWTLYDATFPDTYCQRILPTADGEVVALGTTKIAKSSGWATGSPTWAQPWTVTGTCQFTPWCIDGDGTKIIVSEYSSAARADSRYVHMSLDAGATWTVPYDSVALHGAALADGSHLHGVAYDSYRDRFYVSEGHDDGGTVGDVAGLWCSEDDGATWARADNMKANPSPTVLVSTEPGLVCGSDNNLNGLFGVQAQDDPADEILAQTWRWKTGRAGLIGFARRGYVQPGTGMVFFVFATNYTDVAPIIAAGTVYSGGLVYEWPTSTAWAANDFMTTIVLPDDHHILAGARISGTDYLITGQVGPAGAVSASLYDTGNVLGGTTSNAASSLAVGAGSTTNTREQSVAVGPASSAASGPNGKSVAVGWTASAVDQSTALGAQTVATGISATAVGWHADATGNQGLAVGYAAQATNSEATTVGQSATVSASRGTALGSLASVVGGSGTALGTLSSVPVGHTNSVALGRDSTTTSAYQVEMGPRHIELVEVASDPGNGAANTVRLFARDDGAGKTQLIARFPSGIAVVLATEA